MTLKNPIKKASWLTKTVTACAVLASCAASAPYTVAKNEVLAGGKVVTTLNGIQKITVRESDGIILLDQSYEIHTNGDVRRAYQIDPETGAKTEIDLAIINAIPGMKVSSNPNGEMSMQADELVHFGSPPTPPIIPNSELAVSPPVPPEVPSIERTRKALAEAEAAIEKAGEK